MGIEKRRHARLPADITIRVSGFGGSPLESETARTVDVSESGICFVGARYMPPGRVLKIEFEDCALEGTVRHCRLREYSAHAEFVTGVEIQRVLGGIATWNALMSVVR
ncbi:MAG: PilZ domain-containing protein [Bryobacteraceae bacterium]